MTPLQQLPKNVGDLGKLVAAKGFKKWPKVQKIAQSGHTDSKLHVHNLRFNFDCIFRHNCVKNYYLTLNYKEKSFLVYSNQRDNSYKILQFSKQSST